jgi:hypothetical protein
MQHDAQRLLLVYLLHIFCRENPHYQHKTPCFKKKLLFKCILKAFWGDIS